MPEAAARVRFLPWSIGLVVILLLAGCAKPPPDRSLERVRQAGVLRVGMDASFPPLESVAAGGRLVGIDPSLSRALASQIGVRARLINMGSDGLKDALLVGKVDAVISSFAPVREWSDKLGYSPPYYDAGPVLAITGRTLGAGPIGVEQDGDGQRPAELKWPHRVQAFETTGAALQALADGRVAGAVADAPDLQLFQASHPGLHASGPTLLSEPYVITVRKRNAALLVALDQALARLRSSGELAHITAGTAAKSKPSLSRGRGLAGGP